MQYALESAPDPLPAFAAFGIELEYAIVDRASLDVRPLAPALLARQAGRPSNDVVRGAMGWSNELTEHVVEVKNAHPAALAALRRRFRGEVLAMNRVLESLDACLMPAGMHPWMDPARETRLWRAGDATIYAQFDRLFDCRRHGWANLQSMHVNLPFADDAQFARLHAAIRVVLPLIPALAASSPIADGAPASFLDYRVEAYRTNSSTMPSITGDVIPDEIASRDEYEERVLAPMYRESAPHDPEGVLRHEWLNSRGAIARFDRNAIEIRLCDTQECPRADLAIAAALIAVVRGLYDVTPRSTLPTALLRDILLATIRDGERAVIGDAAYLRALDVGGVAMPAGALWRRMVARREREIARLEPSAPMTLEAILRRGPLARRILDAVGAEPSRAQIADVYRRLCACLANDELFTA